MRVIEIIADAAHLDTLTGIAEQHSVTDFWYGAEGADGRRVLRMLVDDETRQPVIDALQNLLGSSDTARILIMPVEASLPRTDEDADAENKKPTSSKQTREELYERIEKEAHLDSNLF